MRGGGVNRDALIEVIARALRPEDFWNEFADYPTRRREDWETGQQVARIEAEPIADAIFAALNTESTTEGKGAGKMNGLENATIVTVTAKDFDVRWDAEHTFPFFEDENADGVYGYGHTDKAEFARLVSEYDAVCDAGHDPADNYIADDVMHTYAVAYQPEGWPDGEWMFTRKGVTADTAQAFPMTWVSR